MGATLGLVMIVRDERANLPLSLAPVCAGFDEVVVVDTGSTDGSAEYCRSLGARVYPYAWRDDFSAARNYSIAKAASDWLLWLDADNAIAPGDVARLARLVRKQPAAMIWCQEKIVPQGEKLAQRRCFPRLPAIGFRGIIHEQLVAPPLPDLVTDLVIEHWGYRDHAKVLAKGAYYLGLLGRCVARDPADGYARFQLARCQLNLRQFEAAREQLLAVYAAEASPANPDIYVGACLALAQVNAKLGMPPSPREVLEHCRRRFPENFQALYELAKLHYQEGDLAGALPLFQRARERFPALATVDFNFDKTRLALLYYLAACHQGLGQASLARDLAREGLRRDPGARMFARFLADVPRRA